MKVRIGSTAASAVLVLLAKVLGLPEQFQFAFFFLSFSPIWINIIKFFIALIKGKPNVALPAIITYAIALGYYIYKYGVSFPSIFLLVAGITASLIPIALYDIVYTYLDNEGVKSWRWKAFLSFGTATAIGTIFLISLKLYLG